MSQATTSSLSSPEAAVGSLPRFLDRKLRRRLYFIDSKRWYMAGTVAVGLLIVDTWIGRLVLLVGLAWLAAVVLHARWAPDDRQMDAWLAEDIADLHARALVKLDMDESQLDQTMHGEALVVYGPVIQPAGGIGVHDLLYRRGRDRAFRFSAYHVLVLLPAEHHLGVFSCLFNTLREMTLQIRAEEYNYKDIVAVSFTEDAEVHDEQGRRIAYTLASGTEFVPTQTFELAISNGRNISFPVSVRRARDREAGGPPATGLDRTASAIRALLRAKR